jgi:tRNA A-37 threonylcarbamoyl transferase component Bud32/Leucine-rich repeat (LRR) protein
MTQCLSDADILGFVEGKLPAEKRAAVDSHLRECGACAQRLEKARESSSPTLGIHRAPTQVEMTSALEASRGSTGTESHWTNNDLPISAAGSSSPPEPSVSLDQFLSGLSQSGLLPASDLASVRQKSSEGPAFSTVAGLVDWLVAQHKLTPYQAELLARGGKGGLVMGNYIILEKIGQGGMGTVFRARHRRMNRVVALKVLPQALSSIPEAIARFQREVEAAARLQHPHIAAAFDADEEAGVHFLVMEYVDGPNLASYVKQRGALPLAVAVRLMIHAASGLATAHQQGVVHRDIKPGNMMVNKQGVLKVLDMGLAQMRGQEQNLDLTSDVTQTGRVMGTVDYMAPEQARDAKNVDLRADIYSLGCTLWFLATGKAPAPGGSAAEKLLWHQAQDAPPLSTEVPASTPRLDAAIAKMMAKKAEDRFASMQEVALELEQCLPELPAADSSALLDGLDLVAEHGAATVGSSRYGQQTIAGGLGDTILTQFGRRSVNVLLGPQQRKSRRIIYACGIGGALVMAGLFAAPFVAQVKREGLEPNEKAPQVEDGQPAEVAESLKKVEALPQPAKAASPHAPYEKLLTWVFSNKGQITAVTGGGEQLHLTALTALPKQPVAILGIKLDGTGVQDADLSILGLAPGLRELSLADTRITDRGLEQLLPLRQLGHLNLSKTAITNAGLAHLARLSELAELNLERTQITNPGIARLLALPKLERLYLSDTQVTDVGIDQLKALKSLKLLTLHGTSLGDAQHAALKRALPELDIAWDGSDVERGVALKLLDKGATIAVVDRTGQRHDAVKAVESLPPGRVSVKDVNLTTGSSFSDDDLKQIAVLSDVESVSLSGTKVSQNGLAHLQGLTTLRQVDLGTLRLPPTAVESLRKALPGCQVLVREPADVEVARAVLGAGGHVTIFTERNQLLRDLKAIVQLPAGQYSLRAVNLDDISGIDDAALAKLSELPQLESLFLTNTAISDAALARVAACKSLQELGLSGTKITPAGLSSLAPLPKLARLYVAKTTLGSEGLRQLGDLTGLTHLSLLGVQLSDDDLAPLKRLNQLEWLDVSGTPLTDAALTHLARLAKLREINVTGTAISDAAREELAVSFGQGCRIVGVPLDPQRLAARWPR